MPLENVLENIRQLKQAGYHEVVLTGVHLGAYGLDFTPKTSLTELLKNIHESTTTDRIRLSSIEPHELTEGIIKLVAETGSFCNHFHIPLQSGDDYILESMHRPYTRWFFRDLINKINDLIPDAAIGVDTMIGFPGESEKAFENTYSLIKELPVNYLHVFPFSSRTGTPASGYKQKVPAEIIKTRCQRMRELGNTKKRNFYNKFIGKKVEVLIEGKRERLTGCLKGITSNYIPVHVKEDIDLENTMVKVRIDKVDSNNNVFGTVC
jgi:threonylcarbamoyladenosine tRNA methylthiotransferase MtaB